MDKLQELAARSLAGHGAIQVESANQRGKEPLLIMVGGPIKHWWQGDNWGSPDHVHYVEARLKVRDELVKEGHCTYFPNEAIKGSWTERAQLINNAAVQAADVFLMLVMDKIPMDGTLAEAAIAEDAGVRIIRCDVTPQKFKVDLSVTLYKLSQIRKRF